MGTQLLEPFSYLLRKKAKQEEIGKALAVVSNALKKIKWWILILQIFLLN